MPATPDPPMYNRNLHPNERRTPLKKLEKGIHKGGDKCETLIVLSYT